MTMLIKALNKKHVVEANAESVNYKIRTRCLVQSPKTTTQVTLTATFKDLIYASLFEISSEISSVKRSLERAKQNEYEISIFGGKYKNHYDAEIEDLNTQLEKLEIKLEKRKKQDCQF